MAKIVLKEIVTIAIIVVKSYCPILVLPVMVTIQKSYFTIKNPVVMVSDSWLAVILSADTLVFDQFSLW